MKKFFPFLILLSSLILASCAAYYSVFGLSKLYAGASMAVIIMGAAIEAAKLIAASALQRYKKKLGFFVRGYLIIAIIFAMLITSAGIYGFLTNAYQQTATSIELVDDEIKIIESKNLFFKNNSIEVQNQIELKNKRIQQLSNIRSQQENRLDSLYSRGSYNAAKRTESIIHDADNQIKKLNVDIDSLSYEIKNNQDSINTNQSLILQKNSNAIIAHEIGPLKYLSELIMIPMNKVINWFTLMLIFVFDPLAIALIIAYNKIVTSADQLESVGLKELDTTMIIKEDSTARPNINNSNNPESQIPQPIENIKDTIVSQTTPPEPIIEKSEPVVEKILEHKPKHSPSRSGPGPQRIG